MYFLIHLPMAVNDRFYPKYTFFHIFQYSFAHHKKKQHTGKESAGAGVFPLVQAEDYAEQSLDGTRDDV